MDPTAALAALLPSPQPTAATSPATSPSAHRRPPPDRAPSTSPPLLGPLLRPERFYPHLTPELRNRLVALLLQLCSAAGQGAFGSHLLPWLVPLFDLQERDRGWFGADALDPATPTSAKVGSAAGHGHTTGDVPAITADRGFWDVVCLLYPEAVDAVGLPVLRGMLRDWRALELGLQARYRWTPPLGSTVPRATPPVLLSAPSGVWGGRGT